MEQASKPNLQVKKLTTFVITKTELSAAEGLVVYGYFVLVTLTINGMDYDGDPYYLTPPDSPTSLHLPPGIFPGVALEDVSPKMAADALMKMIDSAPFGLVPPAPMEVKWHQIPASKHAKIREKIEKERKAPS